MMDVILIPDVRNSENPDWCYAPPDLSVVARRGKFVLQAYNLRRIISL